MNRGQRRTSARVYGWLLHLLPRSVRLDDGDEMLAAFELLLDDTDGVGRKTLRALHMYVTLVVVASAEWFDQLRMVSTGNGGGLDAVRTDASFFVRTLRRDSGLALLVIFIVGSGIGASATVFSIVNTLLIRPLPFQQADRLVWMSNGEWGRGQQLSSLTVQSGYLRELRRESESFEDIVGYHLFDREGDHTLLGTGNAERLTRLRVTEGFFGLLGVPMQHGRSFSVAEAAEGGPRSVILADGLWRRSFGADPSIVGSTVVISGQSATVIGVLPAGFDFPGTFAPGSTVDFVAPFPLSDDSNRSGNTLALIGRLSPGVDLERAQLETRGLVDRLSDRQSNEFDPWLVPLRTRISGHLQPVLLLLSAAVGLVMLVVCANLANLLLVRGAARRREYAIRSALGADAVRLSRQAFTESTILSLAGAALGVSFTYFATHALTDMDLGVPLLQQARVDGWVLIFALAAAVVTGFLFGALPAFRTGRTAPEAALRQGGRGASDDRASKGLRSALVVAEVALTCVLLVGAGLLGRSLVELLRTDLGFRPEQAFAVRVDPARTFSSMEEEIAYYDDLLGRARSAGGVEAAGITDVLPVSFNRRWDVWPTDRERVEDVRFVPFVRIVTEDYLDAMGMALIAGRGLSNEDNLRGRPVALVNETLAGAMWPDRDPLGRAFRTAGTDWEVVGVTRGMRHLSPDQAPGPEIFLPLRQTNDFGAVHLVVRSAMSESSVAATLQESLATFDPNLPLNDVVGVATIVDGATSVRRFTAWVLGAFAGFTLLLAALGLYGVIAHSVARRRREIGIRLALGESPALVRNRVLSETLTLTILGVAVGMVGSLLLSRGFGSLVYGISTVDPLTFVAVPLLLIAIAAVSGLLPARRASRVDPIQVLSSDA